MQTRLFYAQFIYLFFNATAVSLTDTRCVTCIRWSTDSDTVFDKPEMGESGHWFKFGIKYYAFNG